METSGDQRITDRKRYVNKYLTAHLGSSSLVCTLFMGKSLRKDASTCARLGYVSRSVESPAVSFGKDNG